jgi:hypothetical protein
MRRILTAVTLSAALAVGACASGPPSEESYGSQERKLADDCRERGGILTPSGAMTGRPQVDNVCRISGPTRGVGRDR